MPSVTEAVAAPATATWRKWLGNDALLLTLLPALFLYSGLFERYPLPGWVDPGIYLGYFFDLPDLLSRYGLGLTTYHGARLSWVLPGFWLHAAFPVRTAQELLVALMYFGSVWCAFVAGRGLGGRLGGHLAAAFLAYNPLFVAAVAFGAVDGACVTYLMAGAACLFGALPTRLTAWRAGAFGGFACLAAVAHPFCVPLAGVLALAYMLVARVPLRGILNSALCVLAGGVIVFIIVALLGMQYGFPFWFPAASGPMAQRVISGIGANYRQPLFSWLFTSYRLVIPVVLLVAAVLWTARRPGPDRQRGWAAVSLVAFSWVLFLLFDWAAQGSTLQVRNYTNLALPACALSMAVLATPGGRSRIDGNTVLLHLACLLPAVLVAASYAIEPGWLDDGVRQTIFFVVLGVLGCWLAWRSASGRGATAALAVLTLGCGALSQDTANAFITRTGVNFRDGYVGAWQLVQFMQSTPKTRQGRVLFWYDRQSFTTGNAAADRQLEYRLRFGDSLYRFTYFDTLSSLYLYDRSLLGAHFPQLEDLAPLKEVAHYMAPTVILLSQHPGDLAVAVKALEKEGWYAAPMATHRYVSGQFGYSAWVLQLAGTGHPGH